MSSKPGPIDSQPDPTEAAKSVDFAGTSDLDQRVPIGGVLWYVDYGVAVEVAREQDKALWVHFGENPG